MACIGTGRNFSKKQYNSAKSKPNFTDLNVTRLSLGTALIGNLLQEVTEADAAGAFEAAFYAGVRYVDTAPFYGYGLAEIRVDRAIRIAAVCEGHGVPLKAAALQIPLAHPAIATVLTGVRAAAEFEENERLFRHSIPDAMHQELKAEGLLAEEAPVPDN